MTAQGERTEMEHVAETELVDRTTQGDQCAVEELYRRHYDAAVRFAWSLSSCRATAEDLASEAFERIWKKVESGTQPAAFRGYLYTIVRNLYRDQLRRSRRVDIVDDTDLRLQQDDAMISADHSGVIVESITVRKALDRLSPTHQLVLIWSEVHGLSNVDIARRLDITPNATASLTYRARRALKMAYAQQTAA
jgi:RNA polymerase sigma factor (sigma-70 family)